MRLASPLFTFLFLPLSLLLLPLCPAKHRKGALALCSLVFFLLANFENPLAYLQIGFVVALICMLACIPGDTLPRFRLFVGVFFPLFLFVCARVMAETMPQEYTYPFGLGFVCLGAISLSVDRYRGDAPDCDKPLCVVGYLLLFPTLAMGPLLRYKQYLHVTEHQAPSFEGFSRGATLYMLGYLKRIVITSLLFFSLQSVLSVAQNGLLPPPALILALLLAFFTLYFVITGTTDMARGLLCIYGLSPTRGQGSFFRATSPHRMLCALLVSLDRFLEDYLAAPIKRVFPTRTGKAVAAVAVMACTLLFYRTHPAVLLAGIPLLLTALFKSQRGRYAHTSRNPLVRVPFSLFSALMLSIPALAMMLEDPFDIFSLLSSPWHETNTLGVYHLIVSLSYRHYLMLLFPILALFTPLAHCTKGLRARLSQKTRSALQLSGALCLLVAFFLSILYFLPQFPQFVELAYGKLLL